jgi:hypothetical protein
MKRHLAILLIAFFLMPLSASAQQQVQLWNVDSEKPVTTASPLPVTLYGGSGGATTQAQVTNATGNVPNTSTAVVMVHASTHLIFKTDPAAAISYVDVANGTATTADFRVEPGGALALDNLPSFTQIKIIGASATGTYSVAAW